VRAAVLTAEHHFEVTTLDDPTPGPEDLVLAVKGCGICGSDLKSYKYLPAGSVLGHEFYGEVVAVGNDLRDAWRPGQIATALPLRACGRCRWCVTGEPAHCEKVDLLGVGASAGAFAEFVRVDPALTVALPNGIGELGSIVEPLAVGLHTVHAGAISTGDRVLVIGGGSIGSAVIVWARRFGARAIVVSDPLPQRRDAALALGATDVHDPGAGPLPSGFDVVVECVGAPGLLQAAVDAATIRGRVVVAGVNTEADSLFAVSAVLKELTVNFAVYYRLSEFRAAADLVAAGELDERLFASTPIPLERLDEAFTQPTIGKVLVTP
jgi:(R,R)-butanediol dehydrogenase/meso-butanediol dehydrogenase/diacetyl reductase